MAVQAQAAPDLGLTFGILEIGTDIAILFVNHDPPSIVADS